MGKQAPIEDRLAELADLNESPYTPEARKQLRKHIANKISLIVAKAADIAARLEDRELTPDLVAAFHRFMKDPEKTDRGCTAKTSVVKALLACECDDESLFRRGIRHVQPEPTWGGRSDTAAPLRALCGLGLVQVGSPDAMNELAALLADREADARIGAARALGYCGPSAAALLRLKVLTGDPEPAVLAECFNALMTLSPSASFEFVAGFVDHRYELLYEHAALALSESRLPDIFEFLNKKWAGAFDREFRRALLLPIGLTRSEGASDLLISVLESGDRSLAASAIAALAIYREDASIRQRAEAVVDCLKDAQLVAALRRAFE